AAVRRLEQQVDELSNGGLGGGVAVLEPGPSSHQPIRPVVEFPRIPLTSDRNYWLGHCDGFIVCAGENALGEVEGIRFGSRIDRPDLLEVRCGRIRSRLLLVSVDQVDAIFPEEKRVTLRTACQSLRLLQRVRARLNQVWAPLRVGG